MKPVLIGHCDPGCVLDIPDLYLAPFHNAAGSKALENCNGCFRDDDRSTWRPFTAVSDDSISVGDINSFLTSAGFMQRERKLPVFDYVTQAATRLFQEYIRTMDEGCEGVKPDGIVGKTTYGHMQRWEKEGRTCTWFNSDSQTKEYTHWMNALNAGKAAYAERKPELLKQVDQYHRKTDTRKLDDWTFNSDEIHLIGLRTGENTGSKIRQNNDIFILLINGLVFKFWGSTDPNPSMTSRSDEAYLVEGQHKYRFSWHKLSDSRKIYRALRPYKNGVLVFRDRDNDDALTDDDVKFGVDPEPNHTINIHWSGIGYSNWSAGCQVIAGKSYINPAGEVIDCSWFAAKGYSGLKERKTKGAYNVFADLVLCYAPQSVDYLLYTLCRDDSLSLSDAFPADYLKTTFDSMQT